jgi:glycosyltransferase involved in cell wall biosynthesis
MINKGLVSAYIVFNKFPINFLKDAMLSLKNQTFTNIEYIFVVYGEGNDYGEIFEVLSEVEITFRVYDLSNTENFIDAITFAVKKCNGEYVIRIDADDILMPNSILDQYEFIEKNNCSMVIPNYLTIEEDCTHIINEGKINNIVSHALTEKDKLEYVKFLKGQTFRDGTVIIETFKKYGFKIEYLNKVGFIHRIHKKSLTYDKNRVKIMDNKIKEL